MTQRSYAFAGEAIFLLAALPVHAAQQSQTFAREAILSDNGVNFSFPITVTGSINALAGNVSLGFPKGFVPATKANVPAYNLTPAAFAEALTNCWIAAAQPTFSSDAPSYYSGPPPAGLGDFGVPSVTMTPGQAVTIFGNGPAIPGGLFSVILKTAPPVAVQSPFSVSSLSLPVTAGEFVVCHIDALSLPNGTPEDVELGMTMFYEATP